MGEPVFCVELAEFDVDVEGIDFEADVDRSE